MSKKFYESEWFNINFKEFTTEDSNNIASSSFYDAFYSEFFKKYSSFEDLPLNWKKQKSYISEWLHKQISKDNKVLSFGVGIGFIEKELLKKIAYKNLNIFDFSFEASKWLQKENPNLHSVKELNLIQKDYDLIYLCSTDYSMNNKDLISLLYKLKNSLKKNGKVIIISSSYISELGFDLIYKCKELIKSFLHKIKIRRRGQLWGYLRNKNEYHQIMKSAGLKKIKDGFISCDQEQIYFIVGFN